MTSLLRLEQQQKKFVDSISHISLFFTFGIETINTFIHSRSSLHAKPYSIPDKNGQSLEPVFRPKRRKNHTLWLWLAAHTYMPYIREYHPRVWAQIDIEKCVGLLLTFSRIFEIWSFHFKVVQGRPIHFTELMGARAARVDHGLLIVCCRFCTKEIPVRLIKNNFSLLLW